MKHSENIKLHNQCILQKWGQWYDLYDSDRVYYYSETTAKNYVALTCSIHIIMATCKKLPTLRCRRITKRSTAIGKNLMTLKCRIAHRWGHTITMRPLVTTVCLEWNVELQTYEGALHFELTYFRIFHNAPNGFASWLTFNVQTYKRGYALGNVTETRTLSDAKK